MPIPVLHTHARAIFPTSANSINQGWRGLLGLGWKITFSGHFDATKLSELINKVSSSLTTSISREFKLNQIGEIFLIQYSQVNHILTIFPILALQYSRQHCEVESQWIRPWNRSCPSLTWISNLIGLTGVGLCLFVLILFSPFSWLCVSHDNCQYAETAQLLNEIETSTHWELTQPKTWPWDYYCRASWQRNVIITLMISYSIPYRIMQR